jgi:hypothetical protein
MAISIPIISEFDGKGIERAAKEFKQLEGVGKKAQFAIKKAAVPAGIAIGGLTALLVDATKAAAEDQASQEKLAGQLKRSADATDIQIKSVEDFITKISKATATSDDLLRPALGNLVTATGDTKIAQELLNDALDISVATGKDLSGVTESLAKGFDGNLKSLSNLSPELKDAIKKGADFGDVIKILEDNFKGAATEAAKTAEGGMKNLKISVDEAKEALGTAFLPVLDDVLPKLQGFADWAGENPDVVKNMALAVGGLAGATLALNAAMAVNPYVLAAGGIVAIAVAFERLGDAYQEAQGAVKFLLGAANVAAGVVLPGFLGSAVRNFFGGDGNKPSPKGGRLAIPAMANGGIVTGPTLALIGEAGPEAVVPLDRAGGMGGVTINVNGGDPEAVVNALRRYMNRYGNIPIRTVAP